MVALRAGSNGSSEGQGAMAALSDRTRWQLWGQDTMEALRAGSDGGSEGRDQWRLWGQDTMVALGTGSDGGAVAAAPPIGGAPVAIAPARAPAAVPQPPHTRPDVPAQRRKRRRRGSVSPARWRSECGAAGAARGCGPQLCRAVPRRAVPCRCGERCRPPRGPCAVPRAPGLEAAGPGRSPGGAGSERGCC